MFKNASYIKKIVLTNIIVCLFLILLSCIGLIFNEWVLILCVSICSIVSCINQFLLVKSEDLTTPETNGVYFIIFTFARYFLMVIGFVLSAVIVYFTMPDVINKTRYIMVAIAGIPYIINPFILAIIKKE